MPNRCAPIYARLRDQLHARLGGHCKVCGTRSQLSIDHVNGRDWEPAAFSSHTRMKRYWAEYLAGVLLQLLCRECNTDRENERRRVEREAYNAELLKRADASWAAAKKGMQRA